MENHINLTCLKIGSQASLKSHNQLTVENRIAYFHSLLRSVLLQACKDMSSPNKENLVEILTVFRK